MNNIIVIKIGGIAAKKLSKSFIKQIKQWIEENKKIIIVHGGGVVINRLMAERQCSTKRVNGLRVTSQEDIPVVKQGLLEIVGPNLIKQLHEENIDSLQMVSHLGQIVSADFINQSLYGYVGKVVDIQTDYLESILENQIIPVLASLGETASGECLNINADYLAAAVASKFQAEKLILMTDIEGVLENKQVLPELLTSQASKKIQSGVIHGGMVPKIESAVQTVLSGVNQVLIGDNLLTGTLIAEG